MKSQWWCVLPLSMVARLTPVLFLSAATFLSFFLFSFRLPIQRKFLTMPPDLQSSSEATPITSLSNSKERMQTILYYTSWWLDHASPKTWDLGEGSSPFAHCTIGKLSWGCGDLFCSFLHQNHTFKKFIFYYKSIFLDKFF